MTLIELSFVLAILALLSAATVPAYNVIMRRARAAEPRGLVEAIAHAELRHFRDRGGYLECAPAGELPTAPVAFPNAESCWRSLGVQMTGDVRYRYGVRLDGDSVVVTAFPPPPRPARAARSPPPRGRRRPPVLLRGVDGSVTGRVTVGVGPGPSESSSEEPGRPPPAGPCTHPPSTPPRPPQPRRRPRRGTASRAATHPTMLPAAAPTPPTQSASRCVPSRHPLAPGRRPSVR